MTKIYEQLTMEKIAAIKRGERNANASQWSCIAAASVLLAYGVYKIWRMRQEG